MLFTCSMLVVEMNHSTNTADAPWNKSLIGQKTVMKSAINNGYLITVGLIHHFAHCSSQCPAHWTHGTRHSTHLPHHPIATGQERKLWDWCSCSSALNTIVPPRLVTKLKDKRPHWACGSLTYWQSDPQVVREGGHTSSLLTPNGRAPSGFVSIPLLDCTHTTV